MKSKSKSDIIAKLRKELAGMEDPFFSQKKSGFKNYTKSKSTYPLPENFELNDEMKEAIDLIEDSYEPLFITGKAGSGKSTLINYFRNNTEKTYAVIAPTGIAALNVNGMTIHSFFGFPPKLIPTDHTPYSFTKKYMMQSIDVLIIDEISMVRADVMDAIDRALRKYRKINKPFGEVRIVMVGDLFQLPPVVKGEEMETYFLDEYGGPYFFNAKAFREEPIEKIELKKIYRQDEREFIDLLNTLRSGDVDPSSLLKMNDHVDPYFNISDHPGYITLCSTNGTADRINAQKLTELHAKTYNYTAELKGTFSQKGRHLPTQETLSLKEGAQIMMVKNDISAKKRWVNGSLGIVTFLDKDFIEVEINDKRHKVEKDTWEMLRYKTNSSGQMKDEVIGTFTQYPLRLAWAITIHKSQGKTFHKVHIDLGRGAFAHGQTYVALSRCSSLAGLKLSKPIRDSDIIFDEAIGDFMRED